MDGLLVIVNEKNEFIYEQALVPDEHVPDRPKGPGSPLPFLLAYASLDSGDSALAAGAYTADKYRCATGHTLIFVRKNTGQSLKKFFSLLETALFYTLLQVHTDDNEWLPAGFEESVTMIYKQAL